MSTTDGAAAKTLVRQQNPTPTQRDGSPVASLIERASLATESIEGNVAMRNDDRMPPTARMEMKTPVAEYSTHGGDSANRPIPISSRDAHAARRFRAHKTRTAHPSPDAMTTESTG